MVRASFSLTFVPSEETHCSGTHDAKLIVWLLVGFALFAILYAFVAEAGERVFGQSALPQLYHPISNGAKALTHQVALLEIKEAATVAAGLANPDRVSPHEMRHTFAAHMHSDGGNSTPA